MSAPALAPELLPAVAQRWHTLCSDLQAIARAHPDAVFANSLAAEDMVIQHALARLALPIQSFTLNTGRLHEETLALIPRIQERYNVHVHVLEPDPKTVAAHVDAHGAYAFYDSLELRKACCHLRKVAPLTQFLQGRSAWVTGQRREQSQTRAELHAVENDTSFGLRKFNPLCDWLHDDVWQVIRHFQIPYNPLHDQGYPSIGCDPCTRAIRPGEDLRAGRWWWEQRDSIECGLHQSPIRHTSN
ncbi:MAG TPA: phosphoadenylyl-sulfate reductase [Candidatus Paenalcaligenes intestinipullorum]|uniref:Adenosine 5'-phosphosulfate reductase n=1 Tax=Candidatus Paenalcaligenes intestinipullorum TaxID=2838718 RepID=A0A9D2U9F3_9BURK|nr:phosphoadenylyl-sulfate reductase [Candidatus Paenalcaligenes intestinipullorum]